MVVDGDSIREFRLLVNSLMNRVDDVARQARTGLSRNAPFRGAWRCSSLTICNSSWTSRARSNLVFFHGDYARYYPGFMRKLKHTDEEIESWSRTFDCAQCKRMVAAKGQNLD